MQKQLLTLIISFFEADRNLSPKFMRQLWLLAQLPQELIQPIFIFQDDEEVSITKVIELFPNAEIEITKKDNIAEIFNEGVKRAKGTYVSFMWPGAMIPAKQLNSFLQLEEHVSKVYYYTTYYNDISEEPEDAYRYGLCLCKHLYCLCQLVIHKTVIQELGGFNTDRELQPFCDWEFILRLAKKHDFVNLGFMPIGIHSYLKNYPFKERLTVDEDLGHRLVLGNTMEDMKGKKITILMGYWDYVNVQICFLNYFKYLRGKGIFSFKIMLDHLVKPKDIEDSDLVIFVRTRQELALDVLDHCMENNIKTLFLLDDNWLWLSKDWPELCGDTYDKSNKDYRIFLEILSGCSGVLVYNKYLREDILAYNNNVHVLNTNIDLELYERNPVSKDKIICGYVGTVRLKNEAFKAVLDIYKDREDVDILFMGVDDVSYKSYFNYVEDIMKLQPDILIAPLDHSRSSQSKCPNKYLEIGAIGAAGVYSNVYPYTDVIIEGYNGLLVKAETSQEWYNALVRLIEDEELRKRIALGATEDVNRNYDTKKRLQEFVNFIMRYLGESEWDEESQTYISEL